MWKDKQVINLIYLQGKAVETAVEEIKKKKKRNAKQRQQKEPIAKTRQPITFRV